MKLKRLAFLEYTGKSTPQDYVDWAIAEMERGSEGEEIVQLACLDLIQPLNPEEVQEAFDRALREEGLRFPEEEEAMRAEVQTLHAELLHSPSMDVLQQIITLATDCGFTEVEKVFRDILKEVEAEEIEHRLDKLQNLAKRAWTRESAACLQSLVGKEIQSMEWTGHFIFDVGEGSLRLQCPWRVVCRGQIVFGSSDIESNSRRAMERLNDAFLHETIDAIRAETDTLRLWFIVGDYKVEAYPMSAETEGWIAKVGDETLISLPGGILA